MATRSHNKDKQRSSKRNPLMTTTSTLVQENRQQTTISPLNLHQPHQEDVQLWQRHRQFSQRTREARHRHM
eukprot:7043712-Ditylum_brightwellii.AAC.1